MKSFSIYYLVLSLAFCTCLIISNLVEIKTISLGWLTITGGVILFPISYIINDCVTEVYGYRKARLMVWMGFGSSLAVTLMLQLVLWLPGSAEWTSQDAMQAIYGSVPRIMFASYAAFLCGSLLNAFTMARMKSDLARPNAPGTRAEADPAARPKFGLAFACRAIVSTIFGEGLDSVIFFPIAFAGMLSWPMIATLIVTQTLIKTLYEILVMPLTLQAVRQLYKAELSR